jgi:hypothetical protein
MSLTYTSFVAALANRMAIQNVTSPAFQTELPNIIDAAEQRCYREVDLKDASIVDSSASLTPNSRNFTIPTTNGRFVVVEQINVIIPVGTTVANGTRVPLIPVSLDSLDQMWPSEAASTTPSVPSVYANSAPTAGQLITSQTIRVGAPPDAAYVVEVQGTARPPPLAQNNQTTLLSLYLPDLFFAAAMVVGAAYQRSFGQSADDPKVAQSWENQYQIALRSAAAEEFRKNMGGSAWSPMSAPPEASPQRS